MGVFYKMIFDCVVTQYVGYSNLNKSKLGGAMESYFFRCKYEFLNY